MKEDYQIVPFLSDRFIIIDNDGVILDDANGYGYKNKQNAFKVLNWKYLGGKEKSEENKNKIPQWEKDNDVKYSFISNKYFELLENNTKALNKEIWKSMEIYLSIQIPIFIRNMIKKNG